MRGRRAELARPLTLTAAVALCALAAGCGNASSTSSSEIRAELRRYLKQVEPIRLGVNRLLEGADPILAALHEHRVSAATASEQMDRLEHRFAGFTVDVAAVEPSISSLARLHTAYAHTYLLEDSYLSALATGLATGELSDLPSTQAEQRAAIIGWRTGLTVLARKAHLTLPADLQIAGRGEIAPSPAGGS